MISEDFPSFHPTGFEELLFDMFLGILKEKRRETRQQGGRFYVAFYLLKSQVGS